jgi:transposase
MQLKTILNSVEKHPGFVHERIRFADGAVRRLEVTVRAREGSRPVCSGCLRRGRGYDRLAPRRFDFVPLWGIPVFFLYAMRRVDCRRCGVTVELVPWSRGKSPTTTTYAWFLARWARKLSWKEVAETFQTSWDTVFGAVEMAVEWGLAHRSLDGIEAIGVDEVLWHRGHKYLTVIYQIDEKCRRLLWVGRERTTETIEEGLGALGQAAKGIRYVCSDMWQPYLEVIARRLSQAVHVLDRYHIVSKLNRAIDEVRVAEARRMARDGYEPLLKHSRWCLLKNPSNLTEKQDSKLADLLQYNLKTVRSYLLKEEFQLLWEYVSPAAAGNFLDRWCTRALRSRIEPMKKVARTMRGHRELILNWFRARGRDLRWRGRGPEQQAESDCEKVLRISHLPGHGSRAVSRTWKATRTGARPQILLTRQKTCSERFSIRCVASGRTCSCCRQIVVVAPIPSVEPSAY